MVTCEANSVLNQFLLYFILWKLDCLIAPTSYSDLPRQRSELKETGDKKKQSRMERKTRQRFCGGVSRMQKLFFTALELLPPPPHLSPQNSPSPWLRAHAFFDLVWCNSTALLVRAPDCKFGGGSQCIDCIRFNEFCHKNTQSLVYLLAKRISGSWSEKCENYRCSASTSERIYSINPAPTLIGLCSVYSVLLATASRECICTATECRASIHPSTHEAHALAQPTCSQPASHNCCLRFTRLAIFCVLFVCKNWLSVSLRAQLPMRPIQPTWLAR